MIIIQRGFMVGVMCLFLASSPSLLLAQIPSDESSQEVITLLKEQNRKLSSDLRRIQREIAALRADFDKPDIKDVLGGIGYIFGLFGIAAFVASRRKE
jgi:nickel transport protein